MSHAVVQERTATMDNMEHLNIMHGICMMELRYLMANITAFEQKSAALLDQISGSCNDIRDSSNLKILIAYDKYCSNISAVTNLARKFNLHFQMWRLGSDEYITPYKNNNDDDDDDGLQLKSNNTTAAVYEAPNLDEQICYTQQYILPAEENPNAAVTTASNVTMVDFSTQTPPNPEKETQSTETPSVATILEEQKNELEEVVSFNGECLFPHGYIPRDLSVYVTNSVLTATVTHIRNLDNLWFFICDLHKSNADAMTIARLSNMKHLVQYSRYHCIPVKGEIFGLVLDDVIVRALQLSGGENKNASKMYALLLDLGEIVPFNAADNILYYLSAEFKELPAQAIPCLLKQPNIANSKLRTLLNSWKYQTVKLRVKENDGKSLCVEPLEEIASEMEFYSKPLAATNPFRDDFVAATMDTVENGLPELPPDLFTANANNYINNSHHNYNKYNYNNNNNNSNYNANNCNNKFSSTQLTAAELDILYEETPSTSNPMKAVMGYEPRDDQRICRFYNPKIKCCFKGANCRQEHMLSLKDGWTKDVHAACSVIDNRRPDIIYAADTIICITPTYIGDLEHFYCQINDSKLNTEPIIFTEDEIQDMGGCLKERTPLIFDLVLSRYKDGFWYRAKIIESDEIGKMFKVFYVDYGNYEIVQLQNLAKCSYEIAQWPFQAIPCRLADVSVVDVGAEKLKEALNDLRKNILNKQLDVKVVFHREELIVSIVDERYKYLTKKYINLGYLKPTKC